MVTPATFEDVRVRSARPISEANKDFVEHRLGDAWALLQKKIPGISARMGGDEVLRDLVVSVLCDAVIRLLKNPNSIRSTGIDDGSVTFDTTISSGRLYFLDEELADLMPDVALGGIYSLPMGVPYWGP